MHRDVGLLRTLGPVLLTSAAAFLTGCMTAAPGGRITVFRSELEGRTYVSMSPVPANGTVSLSASWQSDMPRDSLIVEALVKGSHDFEREDSLRFNLGGDTVTLDGRRRSASIHVKGSLRSGRDAPPRQYVSSKQYPVSRTLVRRLIRAEEVPVRVRLRDTTARGTFENDGTFGLSQSLRRLLDKVDGVASPREGG